MLTSRPLRLLLTGLVALAVVACGGDDGGDAADTTTTTEVSTEGSSQPAPGDDTTDPAAGDPYEGYTSEVYDSDDTWICRPDLDDDACRDLDVTTIDASGERTVEARSPAEDPPIDCFYVYPTVSSDPGINSDLEFGPDDPETQTVIAQAAQYAQSCRMFAPVYRQVTLEGLGAGGFAEGGDIAYGDALDAWKTYVSQYNDGRGVIVIGHSQGAGILSRLVAEEIDGNPDLADRLVAAHLFGTAVQVPEGEDVGVTFSEIPACTEADEAGCVVTWSSYPTANPPVDGAIFGKAGGDGERALCVDAVGLLGREHGSAVVPVSAPLVGGVAGVEDVETRFVSLPDAVDVSCATTGAYDYLSVALTDPDDSRPVAGLVDERLGPTWGLHLVDMSVTQDDLVELAARQGAAYEGG
ncbi:MAG: DUF3089 domain-containing protein [Iamia sp.]